MIYRIDNGDGTTRELFLQPGVVLTVFGVLGLDRCRLRRALRPSPRGDDALVEALVEDMAAGGRRTGLLRYVRLAHLFPDVGERVCELDDEREVDGAER